jgi:hypothetical protein
MRCALFCAIATASCGRIAFDEVARDGAIVPVDIAMPTCDALSVMPVPTTGKVMGTINVGGSQTAGTCAGTATDEDIFQIDVTVPGSKLQLAADQAGTKGIALYVRTECADAPSELECDTQDGIEDGPLITRAVPPGRYFVVVDGQDTAQGGNYEATMRVLLPEGAACDDNNGRDICGPSLGCMSGTCQPESCDSAFVLGGSSPFVEIADTRTQPNLHGGTCGDGGDGGARGNEMIYRLDLASSVSNVHVSTDSPDTNFDTLVYVRAGCTGTELACNDDATPDNYSIVDTGPLTAGSYFIFVDAFGPQSGLATVTITLTP